MNIPLTLAISVGFVIVGAVIGAVLFFANQFTTLEGELSSLKTIIQQNQAAVVDELGEEVKNSSFGLRTYMSDTLRPDLVKLGQFAEKYRQCTLN